MKNLVKPNSQENIYEEGQAFCEIYCGGSLLGNGSYSIAYMYCPNDSDCQLVTSDEGIDDILF